MKVLITGATGFLGRPLSRRLSANGHEIVVLSRNVASARRKLPFADAIHVWSYDEVPPAEALEGVEAVINLAGESVAGRWTAAKKRRIHNSRSEGTRNLVTAMKAAGTKVLINASAIGYYGDRGEEELTETSAPGKSFLVNVVQDWERAALAAEDAGTRVVIFRTGIVLGKGGGALQPMLPQFKLGLGGQLGNGQQWWSWVHVEDVLRAFEAALTKPWRGVYNLTSPEPARQADVAHALAFALGRPCVMPAPSIALRLVLGEFADEVLQSKRVLPKHLEAEGFEFKHASLPAALRDLLGEPRLKMQRLQKEQLIPLDIDATFAFFADAGNLEKLTPPWLRFKILDGTESQVHEGSEINYRLRVHGLPISWRSEITAWEPPHRFVDEQRRGPYRRWIHTHTFESVPGGTLVKDDVRWAVPGPEFIGKALVERDLAKIFAYRQEQLDAWAAEQLPGPGSVAV